MAPEKIYYAAVILISAVSILLSPFVAVRSRKRAKTGREIRKDWKLVAVSNLVMAALLLVIWLVWLR